MANVDLRGQSAPASRTLRRHRHSTVAQSWQPPCELNQHQWVVAGQSIGRLSRSSQWWVGDWLLYGDTRWGEKYAHAARITRYDVKSLRNMAWVASRITHDRRRSELSFSHHALVAMFDHDEQERWLDYAVTNRMACSDLRVALKAAGRTRGEVAQVTESPKAAPTAAGEVSCPRCGARLTPALLRQHRSSNSA
jgi:hypothetical protein